MNRSLWKMRASLLLMCGVLGLQGCSILTGKPKEGFAKDIPLADPKDAKFFSPTVFCGDDAKQASLLLKQGAYYQQLNDVKRQKACGQLWQLYQGKGYWQAGWLLAFSFNATPSCIDHQQRVDILNKLNNTAGINDYVAWLAQSQSQTLNTIDALKQQAKVSKAQGTLKKQNQQLSAENAELKSQIQALKAIEKSINLRIGNEPESRLR